jgi:uncharacterized protein (DUF2141 family)
MAGAQLAAGRDSVGFSNTQRICAAKEVYMRKFQPIFTFRKDNPNYYPRMSPRMSLIYKLMTISVFALALAGASAAAHAANVIVHVRNVQYDKGAIRLFFCTSEEFASRDCYFRRVAGAKKGRMKFTIRNVPPGDYAVAVYHDENMNHEVDWDFLGIYPDEAYGVSNMGRLSGKPQFTEAEFQVAEPSTDVDIKLNYP